MPHSYGIIDHHYSISKLDILMTCIVGIATEDSVYIGGDRAASDEDSIYSLRTPKVFTNGSWIVGYCGTIGIAQLIEFIEFEEEVDDPYTYIRLTIVEQLKKAIESFSNASAEHDTAWLIGYKNRLFELCDSDWGVMEFQEVAIGSGGSFALGSLHTTSQFDVATPYYRIECALNAAIALSPLCQGPIDILNV